MDARQFFSEFTHIVSAPGGVQRLRGLVLQLAISGRLVSYDPTDEPVEVTLAEAERKKIQFEIAMKLRQSQPQPPLRESEYPYPIPNHWRWQRLEQIACYIQRGKGPSYAKSGSTLVISQKCVQQKGFNLSAAQYIDEMSLQSYGAERFLRYGDLLLNSTGTGTVGRVAIYNI